jgi:hypothetical protein
MQLVTLDDVLPAPHFRERHRRRIAASPDAVWTALHEVRLSDSPLARVLMDLRTLPLRLGRGRRPGLVAGRFLEDGPLSVLVAEPERIVVGGGVLQPWTLRGGKKSPQLNARALRTFNEPGWVKCAIGFVLEPHDDRTMLRTETRVRTDRRTWLRFALYWFLVRPGSGLVRRGLLRAVARRAEAAA